MYTTEQIKTDPPVNNLLTNYRGVNDQVIKAIELMTKKEDGLEAMRKLVPAFQNQELYVFFSYKKKDERAAKAIVEILRKNSAGKLIIAYMADFPEDIVGEKWRDKIRSEVRRANWFILLLPDSSEDRDWCLYETGLFDREPTSADRLICIHHPEIEIPSEISEYHAVAANKSNMESFLKMVFINEDPLPGMNPINPFVHDQIENIAEEIVDAIRPPKTDIEHKIYEPHICLRIKKPEDLKQREDLDHARIESMNPEALKVFDRSEIPETFGELRSGIKEPTSNGRWRDELLHVVRKIAMGRLFDPVQAVFHTRDEKIYRPVVYAVDKASSNNGIKAFHITFTEEIGALDTSNMSNGFATLATMLRLAFRFRWEILEKYGKGHMEEGDVDGLDNVLQRIEQDARSRGVADKESTDMSLFSEKEQESIGEMYQFWYTLRDPDGGAGKLDIALRDKDTREISAQLAKMIPINQKFLELAANRFSELVSQNI